MKKILLICLFLLSLGANATETAKCTNKNVGQLQCFEQTLCECKLFSTSLMKNDSGGYRFDCGIMRPKCFDDNKISDRENARPYNGPDSVYIDKRGN